jgi:phosphoribosylformylglycinamidine synthase subunit PurQ / glutaminase
MKFGVVIFPGSNCDHDMIHVCQHVLNREVLELWHKSTDISNFSKEDCIILPGGFSFGDYLRTGAIARFSPIMDKVIEHANRGGRVLGICNGFQILCESGLLPGVLLRNKNQKFYCENTYLRTVNSKAQYTQLLKEGQVLKIPVAHAEGRYHCDETTLKELKDNNQILFQYCDERGDVNELSNFNGSLFNIAGIMNKAGNVFGMMPHPERAAEVELGNSDGLAMLQGMSMVSEAS